jgi:hypothetical protein
VVLVAYSPLLRMPQVGEDVQWALRGATVLRSPSLALRPFHLHFRPLVDAFFAAGVAAFDSRWAGYRAAQLVAAALLALTGWALARRLLGGSAWLAAGLVPLWLVCPLVADVFCATSQVQQMLLGAAVLGVLAVRVEAASRLRRVTIALLALAAAATKEEWVVLPVLVLLQDAVWLGVPWRRALRRAAPWAAALAAYVAAYGVITGFQARGFFEVAPAVVAAKVVATLASLWHLAGPVPIGFDAWIAAAPGAAVVGVLLTAAVITALAAWRSRPGLFAAGAAVALALPTAVSAVQAGRYLLLPWLFALLAATAAGAEAWRRGRLRAAVALAGVALVVGALARDVPTVWRDIADWERYGRLQAAVAQESAPVAAALRAGRTVVVLRGDDGDPLAELAGTPAGVPKLYFPRPDDPYGAVSLQAVVSWELRREGLAAERVRRPAVGTPVAAFVHRAGAFVALPGVPAVPVRFPGDPPPAAPGVVLAPVPWTAFAPAAFP